MRGSRKRSGAGQIQFHSWGREKGGEPASASRCSVPGLSGKASREESTAGFRARKAKCQPGPTAGGKKHRLLCPFLSAPSCHAEVCPAGLDSCLLPSSLWPRRTCVVLISFQPHVPLPTGHRGQSPPQVPSCPRPASWPWLEVHAMTTPAQTSQRLGIRISSERSLSIRCKPLTLQMGKLRRRRRCELSHVREALVRT